VTRVDVPKTRKHDTNGHFRTILVCKGFNQIPEKTIKS